MIDVDLALAFTTGMVATVNPCGFAMLPAYLSFFLGIEQDRASLSRALVVAAAVTTGFAATFAIVGLIVSRVTNSVYDVAPWFSLVIGAALAVFGIALLAGLDPSVRLPRLERGGRSGELGSIGCELPLFLAAMSGAFGRNLASGVVYFIVFGIGFGAIMVTLTIALAFAQKSIVLTVRRVLPYVNRIAGALLVLAGAYVAWYGWIEIRDDPNDATVSKMTEWSANVASWLQDNRDVVVVLAIGALAAGAFMAAKGRRADVR